MSAALSSTELGHPKFRVAICGAGIAGLFLAITIGKYDPIPIDLYEARDSIETDGVGIALHRHDMLAELGLFDEFKQIFTQGPESGYTISLRRSDIPKGGYAWFQAKYNGSATMHRQHMIAILEKHLPASCILYSRKRLVDYTEPGQQDDLTSPITLKFEDGTTATTDLLVGADGVRSAVRKALFEAASKDRSDEDKIDLKQYIEATFTGMVIYRDLIPVETLRKENPENISLRETMIRYCGKGKSYITYPIANGTIINFVATVGDPKLTGTRFGGRWVSDADRDEVVESFDNFEPDAKEIVKLCDKPSKWASHVTKPLPFCVRNRVALIGDACHAMTSHYGAGAGEAAEDAFILGRLIAHPLTVLPRIPDAFRVYEEVRLPPAREVARLSLSTGWMSMFMEPGYYDGARNEDDDAYERGGMETIKQEIEGRMDWIEGSCDVLQRWEEAESKLTALVH